MPETYVWYNNAMKLPKKILSFLAFFIFGFSFFAFSNEKWFSLRSPSQETFLSSEVRLSKFAIISDIHSDYKNLERALLLVEENKNDFLIITGDLTTLGKKEELEEVKKILDKSGLRYFVIPGNHDLWAGEQLKVDIYGEVFDYSYKSLKEDGIKYILINNGSDYGIDEKQEKWLESEVEECPQVYCLVFMHIPLNHPKSIYIMGEENPEVASQAANLIKLLSENKIKEVFAGHLHSSSSYILENLATNIVGAITSNRNFESPKYLEVTLEKRGEEIILGKKEVFLSP